jgi:hypothetical protein
MGGGAHGMPFALHITTPKCYETAQLTRARFTAALPLTRISTLYDLPHFVTSRYHSMRLREHWSCEKRPFPPPTRGWKHHY